MDSSHRHNVRTVTTGGMAADSIANNNNPVLSPPQAATSVLASVTSAAGSNAVQRPPVFERFHSFKEFIGLQKNTLEPEIAVQLYDQYKYDFKVFAARSAFQENQNLGYVIDRFTPERLLLRSKDRTRQAQVEAQLFIKKYQAGEFNSVALEFQISDPTIASSLLVKDLHLTGRIIGTINEMAQMKKDMEAVDHYCIKDMNENVLVLKRLPGDVTEEDVRKTCQDLQGLKDIVILPSCWLEENESILMLRTLKDAKNCSEEELQSLMRVMSECYVRAKDSNQPLIPLQTAWLEFDTLENCVAAELALVGRAIKDLCTRQPMRLQPKSTKRIRVASAPTHSRNERDLELSRNLILRLDDAFDVHSLNNNNNNDPDDRAYESLMTDAVLTKEEEAKADKDENEKDEFGEQQQQQQQQQNEDTSEAIPEKKTSNPNDHPFLKLIQDQPLVKRLDLQLLYLRWVHLLDFYSGRLCWTDRELYETCGSCTVRLSFGQSDFTVLPDAAIPFLLGDEEAKLFDRKILRLTHFPYSHWTTPIGETHPLYAHHWEHFKNERTLQVEAEKFRCGICRKLFKGAEFVHKHLKNKHPADVDSVQRAARTDAMMETFDSDEANLLPFVMWPKDFLRLSFQNTRVTPAVAASRHGSGSSSATHYAYNNHHNHQNEYGPQRSRGRVGSGRSGPLLGGPPMVFKDWDAPRNRLEERSAGGNFRRIMKYDDL